MDLVVRFVSAVRIASAPAVAEFTQHHRLRCRRAGASASYRRTIVNCPGSLILHVDRAIAGCSEDDEPDGCRGRDERREGDPIRCWVWALGGCNVCGVQSAGSSSS